jgi:hypothetical protein
MKIIKKMARMFTNSIYYVHEKSAMVELNSELPVSNPKGILSLVIEIKKKHITKN